MFYKLQIADLVRHAAKHSSDSTCQRLITYTDSCSVSLEIQLAAAVRPIMKMDLLLSAGVRAHEANRLLMIDLWDACSARLLLLDIDSRYGVGEQVD